MPKTINFNNQALNGVSTVQGNIYVPEEGEVFVSTRTGTQEPISSIFIRQGNQLQEVSLERLGYDNNPGKSFSNSGEAWKAGAEFLKTQGIDVSKLPQYNLADLPYDTSLQRSTDGIKMTKVSFDQVKNAISNAAQQGGGQNVSSQSKVQETGMSSSDQLVKEALLNHYTELNDLGTRPWWNSQAENIRQEAWAKLQQVTGSAQGLAQFAQQNGISDLQNYSWWSTSPYKNDAWNIIQGSQATTPTTTPTTPGQDTTTTPTSTMTADQLVKEALLSHPDNLTNLQTQSWWTQQPDNIKQEAYNKILSTISSAEGLAAFAQENGISDLQNYSWWSTSPYKNDAWSIIQGSQATTPTTTPDTTTPTIAPQQTTEEYLQIIRDSNLSDDVKALFEKVVKDWDLEKEINIQNIIDSFIELKDSTIDPYFQELAALAIDEVTRASDYQIQQRALQTEAEQVQAKQREEAAQASLEQRGMTFSGEAVKELGAKSAFTDQPSALPSFQFGGDQVLREGKIGQQNRLISSSSQAAFQKSQQDLQRSLERQLGSAGSAGIVPGTTQMGAVTGVLPQEQVQAYTSVLGQLSGQENLNWQYRQPLTLNP